MVPLSVGKQDTLSFWCLSGEAGSPASVNAGFGLTASKLVDMRGFCSWNRGNKSDHAGPLGDLKVHKKMHR